MNTHPDRTPRLCLIKYGIAYFTTKPIADQWGDDWNDYPYQDNAGSPYGPTTRDENVWEIIQVQYMVTDESSGYKTPDQNNYQVAYSVQDINSGKVPWLIDEAAKLPPIHAGCSLETFVALIVETGGACCVKRSGHGDQWYAREVKAPASIALPCNHTNRLDSRGVSWCILCGAVNFGEGWTMVGAQYPAPTSSDPSIESRIRRLEVDSHPKVETVPLGVFRALERRVSHMIEVDQLARATQAEVLTKALAASESATSACLRSAVALERIAACYHPSVAACTHANNNAQLYRYDNFVIHWCRDCGATKISNGEWRVLPTRP